VSDSKWILEVYRATSAGDDHVITLKFESLLQLRLALIGIRDHKFIAQLPAYATAADRSALLDMRAQGLDIATPPSTIT
jgi:hypothetical protein